MEENKQIDLGSFTLYDSTPIPVVSREEMENVLTQRMV